MPTTYVNKVILGNEVLIDVSQDTAVADKVLSGYTFHNADGAPVSGSCTFDANTSDADALVGEVISGKTFYKNGSKLTGTMTNRGAVSLELTDRDTPVTIPQGYHDGSGSVGLSDEDIALLIATNIRENVTVLGVTGSMSGSEDMHAEAKTVTPSLSEQVISPTSPTYNCLSQVTVEEVPVTRVSNGNGICVTICPVSSS